MFNFWPFSSTYWSGSRDTSLRWTRTFGLKLEFFALDDLCARYANPEGLANGKKVHLFPWIGDCYRSPLSWLEFSGWSRANVDDVFKAFNSNARANGARLVVTSFGVGAFIPGNCGRWKTFWFGTKTYEEERPLTPAIAGVFHQVHCTRVAGIVPVRLESSQQVLRKFCPVKAACGFAEALLTVKWARVCCIVIIRIKVT